MLRVADFVQVLEEFAEPLLLQPNAHRQRVVHGRLPNFNPALGNISPFMLHLQILPTFVELMRFRDDRLEGAK